MEGDKLLDKVTGFIDKHPSHNIKIVDRLSREELVKLIKGARFLVWLFGGIL